MAPAPTAAASPATALLYDVQLALERSALRAAIELASPRPDELLLDLATGTGALLRLLARRPDRPRRAVGIDASAAMLRRAPPLPAGWGLIEGDARRLPLTTGAVDVVTCAYLLHLLHERARHATLAEIARILRPGGRAVVVTLLQPRGVAGRALLGPLQRAACAVFGPEAGWCPLDPTDELAGTGLSARRRWVRTRGYASLCLLAERT